MSRAGVAFELHPYDTHGTHGPSRRSSHGQEAADALDIDPGCIFKTLVVMVDGRLTLAVVPVSGSLDLKALAAAVGAKKAAMAEPADAERATGYVVGGISPFGCRTRLPVVVDESVLDLTTVYVSAGRRGLQVSVAPTDLVAVTQATTSPVRRPDQGQAGEATVGTPSTRRDVALHHDVADSDLPHRGGPTHP